MPRATVTYAAMLERVAPADAVRVAALAEAAGFDGVLASDRFQPWVPAQGEAGFVWSVLGALGAATTGSLGTAAVTAGYRMHPAVVAQASATTAALYPGRHWLALGAGEALNEHVVGGYWPEAPERIARMFEALDVVKKLFASGVAGKDVRHTGPHFRLETTRLWTVPPVLPDVLVATNGPVTARRAGKVADGLLTVDTGYDRVATLVQRFEQGRREAARDPQGGRRVLQLDVAWAPTDEQAAREAVTQWPNGALRVPRGDIRSPFDFEQLTRGVRAAELAETMPVSADPAVHRAHLQRYLDLGFTEIAVHQTGLDQAGFVEVYGRDVLPGLTR